MEELGDPLLPNIRKHKTRRTNASQSRSYIQTTLYPKKNYSSFHSVLSIFLKLVEITLSVFPSKNEINENGKRLYIFESPQARVYERGEAEEVQFLSAD